MVRSSSLHRWYGALLAYAAGVFLVPASGGDTLAIRYAAEATHLPLGSDIVALGETGVVLPRHGVASFWNPATPAFLSKYEFSTEFADLYGGLSQHGCVAMAVPLSEGLGASALYMPFLSGPIDRFDALQGTKSDRDADVNLRPDGTPLSSFSNNQHLIVVSVGKLFSFPMPRSSDASFPLPFEIGAGASFKSFWQTMRPDSLMRMGMGANLDAGVIMRVGLDYHLVRKEVSRQLLFGASARDFLPSPMVWLKSRDEYHHTEEYREDLSRSYYSGLSYVDKSGNFGGNWTLSAALEQRYRLSWHYGIEAEFFNMIAFRGGFSDKVPSVGAGIRYDRFFLDYSLRFDELAFSYIRLAAGIRY
ncbi:MAG: hypothetical protein JXA71_10255 [Chitinispirillaceae bacterium]|nr:hypothetical protein [Chitinispirillaceae bacterium]